MSIGPVVADVWPFNIGEWEHTTGSEFARKEVGGIRPPREFVGEDDEAIVVRGKVFPHAIGGLPELEALDAVRSEGVPVLVMLGDGRRLGWFSIERLVRSHTFLGGLGIGQQIEFEATLVRSEQPNGADFFAALYRLIT